MEISITIKKDNAEHCPLDCILGDHTFNYCNAFRDKIVFSTSMWAYKACLPCQAEYDKAEKESIT